MNDGRRRRRRAIGGAKGCWAAHNVHRVRRGAGGEEQPQAVRGPAFAHAVDSGVLRGAGGERREGLRRGAAPPAGCCGGNGAMQQRVQSSAVECDQGAARPGACETRRMAVSVVVERKRSWVGKKRLEAAGPAERRSDVDCRHFLRAG